VVSRDSNPESLHVGGFGLWYLPEGEMTEMRGAAVRLMGTRGSVIVSVGVAIAGEVFPGRGSVLELLWEHLGVWIFDQRSYVFDLRPAKLIFDWSMSFSIMGDGVG